MHDWRQRHDDTRRRLAALADQPGHPIQAVITVTVHGRRSLGRAAPRSFRLSLDLLFGQASEAHLFREIQDAIENTYLSDVHMSRRYAQESSIAERQAANNAEHEAWEAARSELSFTAERPLRSRKTAGR